eukprot:1146730-Pelagomonas_calceolata.AAC.3
MRVMEWQMEGKCVERRGYPLAPCHPAALVSRQYVDMSRIRIEGLLAAFPKLVGTGKQHTYVETENVRYVYQPMEVSVLLPSRTHRDALQHGLQFCCCD